MSYKWICHFDQKIDKEEIQTLVGNKGASLFDIASLGLRVPPWFTITTKICQFYFEHNSLPSELISEIKDALVLLENKTDKKFGKKNKKFPLLLSVRSGAAISMPGMMDTILNLGLNDVLVNELENCTKTKLFLLDSYKRFIEMYSSIIWGVSRENFISQESISEEVKLKSIIASYKLKIKELGFEIPSDPIDQLLSAIIAVIKSWWNPRAIVYRKLHNISDDIGTAVTIQAMVFGNLDENSGTGVVFTRNPINGINTLYGEYLSNAQGEDIVSGIKTPLSLASLKNILPNVFEELEKSCLILEKHYKDVQDIEFTVENGVLYILQSRSAKRAGCAAIKNAVDFYQEGQINLKQVFTRVKPKSLRQVLYSSIDYKIDYQIIGKGLPASPGCASGVIVLSSEMAQEKNDTKIKVILVRHETSAEDIIGMATSEGILTACGGMTSHAAVIARGLGKPCICGANIEIDYINSSISIGDVVIKEGQHITIDGTTGNIILGQINLIPPELPEEFYTLMSWISQESRIKVRANAETIQDVSNSIKFGAEGIGLCRTEHMFFSLDRIRIMRQVILSTNINEKKQALSILEKLQEEDFFNLFRIVNNKPINIRLLDPPLHEFLPNDDSDLDLLANQLHMSLEDLKNRIISLKEANPMLGHRGCRLGITSPEIYVMQIRAIFYAAINCIQNYNFSPTLEIMVPFISAENELIFLKNLVTEVASVIQQQFNCFFDYKFGAMIELPRAALQADILAPHVDFFSFGTNDLTQAVYGMSRDDANKFLPKYIEQKIIPFDP